MALAEARQAEAEQWVAQYAAASVAVQAGGQAAAWASFAQVADWYNPLETLRAAHDAAQVAEALRQQVAGLAAQYVALTQAIVSGKPPSTLSAPRLGLVRAAEPAEVWARPVFVYRETIARGGSEAEAFLNARQRADVLAETEAILANRDAAVASMETEQVTRYRRVLRPELSDGGTCGLCIVAADRIYNIETLMPIHERCKCIPAPIVGDNDPGRTMNSADLSKLYDDAGSSKSADLKRTRYRIDEHGELGPVLEYADKPRRDRATSPANSAERATNELAALLPVLESLEARAASGQDVSGPLGYQRDRIAQLRGLVDAA